MEVRYKVGYTFHVGDLFHIGHLRQIQKCREHLGVLDFLIVGVLSDDVVESYKRKPIIPLAQRMEIYRGLEDVDLVVVQESRDPTCNLAVLRPDVLFHGDDWDEIPGSKWIHQHGGEVIKTPYLHGVSTSDIIEKCKNS